MAGLSRVAEATLHGWKSSIRALEEHLALCLTCLPASLQPVSSGSPWPLEARWGRLSSLTLGLPFSSASPPPMLSPL